MVAVGGTARRWWRGGGRRWHRCRGWWRGGRGRDGRWWWRGGYGDNPRWGPWRAVAVAVARALVVVAWSRLAALAAGGGGGVVAVGGGGVVGRRRRGTVRWRWRRRLRWPAASPPGPVGSGSGWVSPRSHAASIEAGPPAAAAATSTRRSGASQQQEVMVQSVAPWTAIPAARGRSSDRSSAWLVAGVSRKDSSARLCKTLLDPSASIPLHPGINAPR